MIWYDMIWYDIRKFYHMVSYDMIWYDMIWYDIRKFYHMISYDIIGYDIIWYDIISYHIRSGPPMPAPACLSNFSFIFSVISLKMSLFLANIKLSIFCLCMILHVHLDWKERCFGKASIQYKTLNGVNRNEKHNSIIAYKLKK